jgi:hypothetical protein
LSDFCFAGLWHEKDKTGRTLRTKPFKAATGELVKPHLERLTLIQQVTSLLHYRKDDLDTTEDIA